MKNLNTIITAVLFTLFALTSCQKEKTSFGNLEAIKESKEIVPEGAENLTEMKDIKTFQKFTPPSQEQLAQPITVKVKKTEEAVSRNSSETIACGVEFNTTRGKFNNFNTTLYHAFNLDFQGANMDGGDNLHGFYIDQPMTISFELLGLSTDMHMFLFNGSESCSGNSCSYRLNRLVVYSITNSNREDAINNVYLAPGFYLLVVDAPYGMASNYNLRNNCDNTRELTSSICLLYGEDDFENYVHGDLTEQSCHWSKWTRYSTNDAVVQGNNNQYIKLKRQSSASAKNQPDILLNVNSTESIHHISFKMWVPANRSGSFNIQKDVQAAGNDGLGAGFFFNLGGTGYVLLNSQRTYFNYTPSSWMNIYLDIHNDENNSVEFYINDELKAGFPSNWNMYSVYGSRQLEAINFYPHRSDGLFYLDNVEVLN